jgi:group I intron endonuclease
MTGSIYKISFPGLTNKVYIGKTERRVRHRVACHRCHAYKGSPYPLHRAILKYGAENMKVEVLAEEDDPVFLNFLEMHFIRELQTMAPKGYNLTKGGDGAPGLIWTPERRRIQSENTKGKKRTLEQRKRMSECRLGTKYSLAHRLACSLGQRGRKLTEEHKEKLSLAHKGQQTWWKGRKHTEESRLKMREAHLRRKVSS